MGQPLDRTRSRVILTAAGAAALGVAFLVTGVLSAAGRPVWLVLALMAFAVGGLNIWVLTRIRGAH